MIFETKTHVIAFNHVVSVDKSNLPVSCEVRMSNPSADITLLGEDAKTFIYYLKLHAGKPL